MDREQRPEDGLKSALLKERASNTELAERLATHIEPLTERLLDRKELALLHSLLSALRSWNGHVASFGYCGVRTRRATICLNMEAVEAEKEVKRGD